MIYINFTDIICDTEGLFDDYERMKEYRKDFDKIKYLDEFNWYGFLGKKKPIKETEKVLKSTSPLRASIVLTVNTMKEAQAKIGFLKANNFMNNIIICPYQTEKADIIIPSHHNKKSLLVDTSLNSLTNWIKNGGYGLMFSKNKYMICPSITNIQEAFDFFLPYEEI